MFSRNRAVTHPSAAADLDTETLVGVAFDDVFRAEEFLTAARGMQARQHLVLKDAVLVISHGDGRTEVRETIDPQGSRAAISGAIWVSLLGLLVAGPAGWLAGAAVGAGTGAVVAKAVDLGIPDEWVAWFQDAAHPGTATVALLVTHLDRNALVAEVERFRGARLVYANLDDHTVGRIADALGHLAPPPSAPQAHDRGEAA